MSGFDISLIMTFHSEGRLAHISIRNALKCIEFARSFNINIELIGIMDNINELTRRVVDRNFEIFNSLHEVFFGDLGPSRNFAINKASGKFIAFLDADDLFDENWLVKAFKTANQNINENYLYHPHYMFCFTDNLPSKYSLRRLYDFKNVQYNDICLLEHCFWPSLCFGSKEIFLNTPYRSSVDGFGYEDWDFNCDVIANGYKHYIVAGTCQFVRIKENNSLSVEKLAQNKTLSYSKLFDQPYLPKLLYKTTIYDKLIGRLYFYIQNLDPGIKIPVNSFIENILNLNVDKHGIQSYYRHKYIPKWIQKLIPSLHKQEPKIFNDFHDDLKDNAIPKPFILDAFFRLKNKLTKAQFVLFLDKNSLNCDKQIASILSSLPKDNVFIISFGKLKNFDYNSYNFIDLNKYTSWFYDCDKELLLLRLLVQLKPKIIYNFAQTNVNVLIFKYFKALSLNSRLNIVLNDITDFFKIQHNVLDNLFVQNYAKINFYSLNDRVRKDYLTYYGINSDLIADLR